MATKTAAEPVHEARIAGLRASLRTLGLDAMLISRPEHRRYLSGFSADVEEDGVLVVSREGAWVLTDFRYIDQVAHEAPAFALSLVRTSIKAALTDLLTSQEITTIGFEAQHLPYQTVDDYRVALAASGVSSEALVPTKDVIDGLRLLKDDSEKASIREAARVADEAFALLLPGIRAGMSELDIAAQLEGHMRGLGSTKPSFQTIVASGARGALPHGTASMKAVGAGELVTIDFGAVVNGYHSDITRTVAVGEPGERARSLYDLVLKAQEAGLAAVRAGAKCSDVDGVARAIIAEAGLAEQFGHGLGHGVGLMIHEAPRLSGRSDEALASGMVVTVEPGVYLSGWGGIRIEDLVIVTDDGCEVLSRTPKGLLVL